MTIINKDTAYYLAKLSALEISDIEAEKYSKQLTDIIEYAEKLNELDTAAIDPSFHSNVTESLIREDVVVTFDNNSKLIENAPAREGTAYAVPKILD